MPAAAVPAAPAGRCPGCSTLPVCQSRGVGCDPLTLAPACLRFNASLSSPSVADFGGVRLVGGGQSFSSRQGDIFNAEGRLEVLLNGQWGTVCNQNFDKLDMRAVCRHLGLWYSGSAYASASGELPMVATKVGCNFTSSTILECAYSVPGIACTRDLEVHMYCNKGEWDPDSGGHLLVLAKKGVWHWRARGSMVCQEPVLWVLTDSAAQRASLQV